jgi:1-acyl-sn-glycerol-3-phosphate acyltransferase
VSALPLPASASVIDRPLVRGFSAWLGATLLSLAGWKVLLAQPVPARCVVIFYPHTSNWDTAIGLCLKFMTGLAFRFAGKDSLFRVPILGPLLIRWGGVPVNRRERTGFTEQMEGEFRRNEVFRLAIAPEGTRGRTEFWKSGFYHLARAANVPLALGYIDYSTREIGVGGYLETTGDREADMARLRAFYSHRQGRNPGDQSPIRFRDDPTPED